jgi:aldehyde dehydrogenase
MFAFNQGAVCTCPSRALIHEKVYDRFMERALKRVGAIVQNDPLDLATMTGALVSRAQLDRILSCIDIGRKEGADVLAGGTRAYLPGDLAGGYYVKPTVFKGDNGMRIFQEEILGPVVCVATFKTDEEAVSIANNTPRASGAGLWSRDASRLYRCGRAVKADRVWANCYHTFPAQGAFSGGRQSAIGQETRQTTLNHYQRTRNLLVSYSPKKLGFF